MENLLYLSGSAEDQAHNPVLTDGDDRRYAADAELYRSVFENSNTALLVIEADSTVSRVNLEFEKLSGFLSGDIEGRMKWMRFIHPEDVVRMQGFHCRRRQTGENPPNVYEFRLVNRAGDIRHILMRVSLLVGSGRSICSLIDITSRIEAEKALLASEAKYRTVLDSIDEGYFELDLAGNLTFVNDAICRITGLPRETLLNMNNREFASPRTAREMFRVFNTVFRTGRSSRISRFRVEKGSRAFDLEMVVSLVKDDDGNPAGFRGLVRNVAEKVKSETKQVECERLQGVVEMAGAVCHELNQPLQSIMGYSQLLQLDVPEDFPGAGYLEKIISQVERLKNITGKLMCVTRYETVEYLNGSKIVDLNRASSDPD